MGDDRRRLEEKEAFVGGGGGDPPAAGLLNEMFVVLRRFKAEEGEPEAVLAATLSVAATAIAAVFREHRDDPAEELDRRIVAETFDDQRDAGLGNVGQTRNRGDADDNLPLTVSRRDDNPLGGDLGEGFRLDPVNRLAGDVTLGFRPRLKGADNQLAPPLGADEMQRA